MPVGLKCHGRGPRLGTSLLAEPQLGHGLLLTGQVQEGLLPRQTKSPCPVLAA